VRSSPRVGRPEPLRIVHVYNWLDPTNGGPPRVVAGLAAGQQRLGHEVRFVSSDRADSPELDAFLRDYLPELPPRWVVRPKFFVPIRSFPALWSALEGADVAHLHGLWPPAPMLASQMCRLRGIPYVFAPHGSLHGAALRQKPLRKLVGRWLLGWGRYVSGAAALHVLNADEAHGATGFRLPKRVSVIPNGVFAEHFESGSAEGAFRASIPGLGDAPYVLFLSRLHWSKGCDLLGETFARLAAANPEVHLVAIGPDQGGAGLLRAGARGFLDRVHVTGEIRGSRKDDAVRECAAFFLPSRHEGFSIAVTEALAWGRPVVISDACHFPLVAEVGCGHVAPLDPPAFADALGGLLADPEAAEAMGRRGRELVLERFTWPEIAAQTIDLYRSL